MRLRSLMFFVCLSVLFRANAQKSLDIEVHLEEYDHNEIYLAYYFGNTQYIRDTAKLEDGVFRFRSDTLAEPGVYLVVLPPDNHFFQLLLTDDDQEMVCRGNAGDLNATLEISGSPENKLFTEYMRFITRKKAGRDSLAALAADTVSSVSEEDIEKAFTILNQQVQKKQQDILSQHPESMTALLVKASKEVEIPEFEGDKQEQDRKRFYYYRKHFFDHIDFSHPALVRTPFLFPRIDEYINKLTVQHPDSISAAIDHVLSLFDPESEAFRFYLIHFLNNYASSKIVGMDAVYVHIVENYYAKGHAPWTDEEQLVKIIDNAKKIKPLLIGKIAPDMTMQRRDGSEIRLHKIEAPYTVLFFWDPECGHCKKAIPKMIEFLETFKDRGVEVFAVCTLLRDKVEECWEAVDERDMHGFINVIDPWMKSRFKQIYDIRSTPQVYILDEEKKIIMKKIGAEKLPEVMERIMTSEHKS